MTRDRDFDALFKSLGLEELPLEDVTIDATFVPEPERDRRSGPRKPIPLTVPISGTLPRLELKSPELAKLTPDQSELEPLQVIGEGGMGRVLLARQSSLDRAVAVKILRGGQVPEGAADALIHEARTTGRLEHPSVVPVYALARDGNGQPAVVMKRVEGVVWKELLHQPQHPAWARFASDGRDRLAFNIEVLVQVCNAVAHAHQRGIIHRDVKPANVLLGELGEIYLADWGVALERSEAQHEPIRLVGTPTYMAPEMVTGDPRHADERTDVYLLGATLHELLIGAPPHVGTDLKEVLMRAWESAPPTLPASAPPLLAETCRSALSADPAQRFQTVTSFRDELKRYLQHRGASELASAAQRRLAELEAMRSVPEGAAEQRRWYTLVSECRFGFKQALEVTPDHAAAREGLRRCLEVAARHELERGAGASARAFLAELEQPPAALTKLLAEVEAREAERLVAEAEMKRLGRELDLEVGRRPRTAMMIALAVTIVTLVTAMMMWIPREEMEARVGTWFRILPLAFTAVIFALMALVGRKDLFSNRINRQLMGLIGVGLLGSLIQRTFSVWLGMPNHAALSLDAVMYGTLCIFASFTLHRGFISLAVCFFIGAVACALFPPWSPGIFGISAAVALAVGSVVMWRWSKAEPTMR